MDRSAVQINDQLVYQGMFIKRGSARIPTSLDIHWLRKNVRF